MHKQRVSLYKTILHWGVNSVKKINCSSIWPVARCLPDKKNVKKCILFSRSNSSNFVKYLFTLILYIEAGTSKRHRGAAQ